MQLQSLGWEDPLEKAMATHSVFLSGESHGQRSMAGNSPWDCKELDMTERTWHPPTHTHTQFKDRMQDLTQFHVRTEPQCCIVSLIEKEEQYRESQTIFVQM